MNEVFRLLEPSHSKIPLVVSIPHCGTEIPPELVGQYAPQSIRHIDDTDWFVDRLYDFAPELGATMICAKVSRWVIDLNRDPSGAPLYKDGRIITGLCPVTDFLGNPIYADHRSEVASDEIDRRLAKYFNPYHQALQETLAAVRDEFGAVLLWDCHSIRQFVPTIHPGKFPDLILGSADETSASNEIINAALSALGTGKYALSHNFPFKGGFITRRYGNPSLGIHALQLEMAKINYMDDEEVEYDVERADMIRAMLKPTLRRLSELISL
jgi:N-formylglutamate deformylase